MKKIIFCDIPMKKNMNAMVYANTGNTNFNYSKEVMFPINAILAESLKRMMRYGLSFYEPKIKPVIVEETVAYLCRN